MQSETKNWNFVIVLQAVSLKITWIRAIQNFFNNKLFVFSLDICFFAPQHQDQHFKVTYSNKSTNQTNHSVLKFSSLCQQIQKASDAGISIIETCLQSIVIDLTSQECPTKIPCWSSPLTYISSAFLKVPFWEPRWKGKKQMWVVG